MYMNNALLTELMVHTCCIVIITHLLIKLASNLVNVNPINGRLFPEKELGFLGSRSV